MNPCCQDLADQNARLLDRIRTMIEEISAMCRMRTLYGIPVEDYIDFVQMIEERDPEGAEKVLRRVRELKLILREIEWQRETAYDSGDDSCAICFAVKSSGHKPDCRLAKAIA